MNYLHFVFIMILTPLFLIAQPPVEIMAENGIRERLIDFSVDDAPADYSRIANATNVSGQFSPMFVGHHESDARTSMFLIASTSTANDISNSNPLLIFDARVSNAPQYLGISGTGTPLSNRPLFGWNNYGISLLLLSAEGNLGLGTNAPKSKLQIKEGDVYLEDINSGIIMKSPNLTCWRVQIDNNGELIKTALSNCPQ